MFMSSQDLGLSRFLCHQMCMGWEWAQAAARSEEGTPCAGAEDRGLAGWGPWSPARTNETKKWQEKSHCTEWGEAGVLHFKLCPRAQDQGLLP